MDVAVHCLDASVVKSQGLHVAFPALCKYVCCDYTFCARACCRFHALFMHIKLSKH